MKFPYRALSILIMMLAFSPTLHAQEEPETFEQEPCSEEEGRLPEDAYNVGSGDVIFVSGGIGYCEAQEMRRIAPDFQLELMMVKRTPGHETYLASIPVIVTDSKGSLIIDTVTKGPFLLANLPTGRYEVSADYNGEVKSQRVTVSKKHQRIVFVWRE